MSDNLSPPRGLFSWFHINRQRYRDRRTREQNLRQAIEMIVDVADPGIRLTGRQYRKTLRSAVEVAMEYCTTLVESIPGPVCLSRKQYHADPLVKAIFVSADELEEVLLLAPESEEIHDQGNKRDIIALLTMTRKERTIFGHEQHGEIIRRDVAKRAVSFIDHRMVAFGATLDTTLEQLKHRALEVLATVAMEKIASLRGNVAELRERRVHLKSMLRIFGGRNHTIEMFAPPNPEMMGKLRKVKKLLAEVEIELEAARNRFETPEDSLALLQEIISIPGDSLILRDQTLYLDWMNVRIDGKDGAEGNDISLAELSVKNELQRSAVLVAFTIDDLPTD